MFNLNLGVHNLLAELHSTVLKEYKDDDDECGAGSAEDSAIDKDKNQHFDELRSLLVTLYSKWDSIFHR